jgi:hypothetical protein
MTIGCRSNELACGTISSFTDQEDGTLVSLWAAGWPASVRRHQRHRRIQIMDRGVPSGMPRLFR